MQTRITLCTKTLLLFTNKCVAYSTFCILDMSLRLAFNCKRWFPTKEQFMTALSMIQSEERKRVCGFVFQRDVKTALIGRLMIRKAIRKCINIKNKNIILGRTDHGRPFLEGVDGTPNKSFDFNISHQDDMVVLAAETSKRVGIDTMCLERPVGSPSMDRFFELMRRQLSNNEWSWIHSNGKTDKERLVNFYRIWCMKESYVKAIGLGISHSLSRLDCNMVGDFTPQSTGEVKLDNQNQAAGTRVGIKTGSNDGEQLVMGKGETPQPVLRSSFLRVDERMAGDWSFEETLLLGRYLVCVAVENNNMALKKVGTPQSSTLPSFQFLTIDELLKDSIGGDDDDHLELPAMGCFDDYFKEWELFIKKEERPNKK